MPDHPIRLIATDLDGTLLDSRGIIPDRNIRAIRAARERGVAVAVATGRFPENAYLKMEDFGLRCPVIGVNGARTLDENLRQLTEHVMDPAAAERVLETVLSFGAECFMFAHRAICTCREGGQHHSELSQKSRVEAMGFTYYHGIREARMMASKPVHKFYIRNSVPLTSVREALEQIPDIQITQSGECNIEVMPKGIDKGLGIREYAGILGVPMDCVMALGDECNDIPMLEAAGWSVAMGNACPAARDAARFVTGTNDQCGFAQAVERLVLGGAP